MREIAVELSFAGDVRALLAAAESKLAPMGFTCTQRGARGAAWIRARSHDRPVQTVRGPWAGIAGSSHLRIESATGGTVRFTSDVSSVQRTPVFFVLFLILALFLILMDAYGAWVADGGGPPPWQVIKLVLECAGWLFMAFGMLPLVRWSLRRALDRWGRALLEAAMAHAK